jgi:hypothetical protein
MKKPFKNDSRKEIVKDDLIYSSSFYERLKKTISENVESPFSISLEGEWGSGKTFLMKLLMNELSDEGFTCIWFNPWEYENDKNIFLAFLQKLSQELDKYKDVIKQFGIFSLSLFTSGLDIFGKIISKGSISYKSVKEIVTDIDESLKKTFEGYEDIQSRIKKDFISITNDIYKSKNKPVIIFFDDLDRCLPENTLALIELLKNYFNVHDAKAIFVFGQNPNITRDFIKTKYKDIPEQFVNDYYKKVFDFCINLPQLTTDNVKSYIEQNIKDLAYGVIIDINELKLFLIQRNLDFKNKSLRVIDKIIFNILFFSDSIKEIGLDFLIFWHFSQELKPLYHTLLINSILENEDKVFSEISSCFDSFEDKHFEKRLYKDFIQKYNYTDANLIKEKLLCLN